MTSSKTLTSNSNYTNRNEANDSGQTTTATTITHVILIVNNNNFKRNYHHYPKHSKV